jgi:hypothetical protein
MSSQGGFDADALRRAEKYAELQEKINGGLENYIEGVKSLNKLKKDLETVTESIKKLQEEEQALINQGVANDDARLKLTRARLHLLNKEKDNIESTRESLKEVVKDAKKWSMLSGQVLASTVKMAASLDKIPGLIGNITNKLKDLFEMDKSIRMASKEMGLLSKASDSFRKNITSTSMDTIGFGVGIKELAELQSGYAEAVGRNVMMNEGALKNVAAMAKATNLGIEGAAQMTAEFDAQGLSAEKTAAFVQGTLDSSSKMGLNSAKVMKNISGNIKMLNRYRFKDGAKGLAKMAETVTKLGVDMNFVSGMADRLFDLEPAIEMSAQLQVMGGAWADLADPFKLMYMARNDTNALTESVANAAKESMSFAKDGSIETTAEAMHKLRIVAQQTGLEYDDLMEAGKKAFKMGQIKTKVFGVDDETKEFIANTAEFANGKATITIDGQPKLLSMLTKADKDRLKEMVNEKKTMEERAKAALSFDEKITNLINMVKISMMPIVEGISSVLGPLVDDLMGEKGKTFRDELVQLGKDIGGFVAEAASWIKGVANLAIALGPQGIFYTWLTGKALMFLFEKANWVLNGVALSTGFLGGQAGKGLASMLGTGFAKIAGPLLVTAAAGVAGNWLGKKATEASGRKSTKAGDNWGTGLAIAGGALGLALAPFTGGASLALSAAALGGTGALLGGLGGKYFGDMANQDEVASVNDGIIKFNKNDKFTKVNDSTMIAGTNENGNKDLARTLKYASLASMPFGLGSPMLMSEMMKGGVKNSTPGGGKIEFGELHITGEIKVSLPGGTQIGSELVKSPEFKSSITKMVNSQIEKNMNGGKNRG